MIKFMLVCEHAHEFEGWFRSGADYDAQAAASQVACPRCGSHAIEKGIMAPAVARRAEAGAMPAPAPQPEMLPPQEIQNLMRRIRDEVHAKAEYVGGRFAEEARRIHFDESPARGIYGEASADEARELAEEGVPFLPMPRLPEDLN